MTVRIGISGWRYGPWRGIFYPDGLAQHAELAYAARIFPSIEINGTFYSLQRPECFDQWYRATPPGFVFAVKGSRYITHMLRLLDAQPALANFFAQGLFNLREKLGPILWQFPASFRFDPERFERFFALLPRDTEQALALARHRDARVRGRSRLAIDANRRLRHAVEIRHGSFVDPAFVRLLRRYGIALVVADAAGLFPYKEDMTADFVYMRLHGDTELYASGYGEQALGRWAGRIRAWAAGGQPADADLIVTAAPRARRRRDVYCYFDNDAKVKAPFDAAALARKLGMPLAAVPGAPLPEHPAAPRRARSVARERRGRGNVTHAGGHVAREAAARS
jgi:uncharacterized protein YecE (DUF72 family)